MKAKDSEWLLTSGYPHRLYCPNCFKTALWNEEWADYYDMRYKFCPYCGKYLGEYKGKEESTDE